MLINPEEVHAAFLDCLFLEEEITDGKPPKTAVLVEGIQATFALHPMRLMRKREQVGKWLFSLPEQFRADKGGGWSFLNACYDVNGEQWTGLHQRMDELFCMGLGLGIVSRLMPREMWDVLPGGMPYYAVQIKETIPWTTEAET